MAIKNLPGITVSPGNIRSSINCDFLDVAKGTFIVGLPDGYYFSKKMERVHYALASKERKRCLKADRR